MKAFIQIILIALFALSACTVTPSSEQINEQPTGVTATETATLKATPLTITPTLTLTPPPPPSFKRYRFEFQTTGNWIPIPQEHSIQKEILLVNLSQEPSANYIDPTYGNKILFFQSPLANITGVYEFTSALPRSFHIEEANINEYDRSSDIFKLYTRSETWIEADSHEIVELANSIVDGETNPYLAARTLYDYLRSTIANTPIPWTGDETAFRSEYGALATHQRGYGTCQNQALLFVALCRSIGIPARVVHGINGIDLDKEYNIEDVSHAWAEFYLPGFGWIPVDPTMGDFAELDNFHIVLSVGNNLILDPSCNPSGGWICDNGTAMFLVYPIFGDLNIKVTQNE